MNELQQVINFTDADLKANAEGYLSTKQRAYLHSRQTRSFKLLMGVAGIVSLMAVGAIIIGSLGMIVLGVMALVLAIMSAVEYVVGYQSYSRDLKAPEIETIQGVVHYIWRGDSVMGVETRPSGIRIGDIQFLLMEDQARAFVDGDIYALHFAPATHTLLSAEPITLRHDLSSDAEVAYWDESENQSYSASNQ
ncbi:MAG: hypothetical protein Phog2KO_41360 [Phototrophicaceae bacterium]